MRRAALVILVGGLGAADGTVARAPPTVVTAEAGAEVDTNVQRVETGPGLMTERVGAAVGRFGAKLDHRGKVVRGGYALALSAMSRVVGNAEAASENVTLLVADLRWLRAVGERPVSVGFAITGADAMPLSGGNGARTFRTIGAEGLLVLRGGDERALTIAIGGRSFTYKPERAFDWIGPTASVRLDLTLWQPAGGTRSLELGAFAGAEARAYDSQALASACPDDAPPDPTCFAGTSLPRRDRYQRLGVELTSVGRVVAAINYQLTVTDSNSFGQSLVRHRVGVSATTDLPWKLYGTALATLQIDQYLDGLIVQKDLQNQTFTTLDDENRSSLQLRLAREVSGAWSVETRAAIWRDLGSATDGSFRRALVYVGAMYSR